MNRFTRLEASYVVLDADHVDTDQITPARFLKITDKLGLRDALFADWRREPGFVLNRPEAASAEILVAGHNFGCGSSREHAPWALVAWGFRAVLARSFADIFRNNALKNGLVPVAVDGELHAALRAAGPGAARAFVDLEAGRVGLCGGGPERPFSIDPFSRHCLLNGLDELGFLRSHEAAIARWESSHPVPFAHPEVAH